MWSSFVRVYPKRNGLAELFIKNKSFFAVVFAFSTITMPSTMCGKLQTPSHSTSPWGSVVNRFLSDFHAGKCSFQSYYCQIKAFSQLTLLISTDTMPLSVCVKLQTSSYSKSPWGPVWSSFFPCFTQKMRFSELLS